MGWKAHATFSPKISRTHVFDLTRTCDDKQRAHLPKAVEMADRGSGDRGSHNSLIRGCDCLPSRAIANTTSCDRFQNIGLILPTIRRPLRPISIFPSRRPDWFRQPILLNLRKLVA